MKKYIPKVGDMVRILDCLGNDSHHIGKVGRINEVDCSSPKTYSVEFGGFYCAATKVKPGEKETRGRKKGLKNKFCYCLRVRGIHSPKDCRKLPKNPKPVKIPRCERTISGNHNWSYTKGGLITGESNTRACKYCNLVWDLEGDPPK